MVVKGDNTQKPKKELRNEPFFNVSGTITVAWQRDDSSFEELTGLDFVRYTNEGGRWPLSEAELADLFVSEDFRTSQAVPGELDVHGLLNVVMEYWKPTITGEISIEVVKR